MNRCAKCCLVLALVAGSLSIEPRPAVRKVFAAELLSRPAEPFRWLGISSCSAAACHGNGMKGFPGGEHNIFTDCDPHFKAYRVLLDERSVRIIKNLQDPIPAEHNPLCLACHSANVEPARRGPRFTCADGVGCESCHGPAEKWVSVHYLSEWKHLSEIQKADMGFRPTKNLLVRAQLCVDCHVGTATHEVNHDLIAAGHPRLNFELASYLGIYPKHWNDRAEKAHIPDLEARVWQIGQVVSAKAALELLADRAGNKHKPWPEFAELNCYACHKDLPARVFEPAKPDPKNLGRIPMSQWYTTMLDGDARGRIAALRDKMRLRVPDRDSVAGLARSAAQELQQPMLRVAVQPTLSGLGVQDRLKRLFAAELRPEESSWDAATQRYLGLAALYQALGDLCPELREPGWRQQLEALATKLAFPKGQDSPKPKD